MLERARGDAAQAALPAVASTATDAVSAERGYLREVGNLLFHLSVLVVLVGLRASAACSATRAA